MLTDVSSRLEPDDLWPVAAGRLVGTEVAERWYRPQQLPPSFEGRQYIGHLFSCSPRHSSMLPLLFSCSASQEKTNMWRWWKWKLLLPCRNDMPSAAAHWTLNLSTTESGHDLLTTHADRSAQNDSSPPPKRHPFHYFSGWKTSRLRFIFCVGRVATEPHRSLCLPPNTHGATQKKYTKIKWLPRGERWDEMNSQLRGLSRTRHFSSIWFRYMSVLFCFNTSIASLHPTQRSCQLVSVHHLSLKLLLSFGKTAAKSQICGRSSRTLSSIVVIFHRKTRALRPPIDGVRGPY